MTLVQEPEANMIFARFPRHLHQKLFKNGAVYYVMDGDPDNGDPDEMLMARFVTDWSITAEDVDQFLSILRS